MSHKSTATGWIVSPRYDGFYFTGSVLLSPLLFLAYLSLDSALGFNSYWAPLLIFLFFATFFDHPHIFQTFSRTLEDREEFKRNRVRHGVLPLLLIGAGFFLTYKNNLNYLIPFIGFYGIWHIICTIFIQILWECVSDFSLRLPSAFNLQLPASKK